MPASRTTQAETEKEYFEFTNRTNRFVELVEGCIEWLPWPTALHQRVLVYLMDSLRGFVEPQLLGMVLVGPFQVRIRSGRFRMPDIVFMGADHAHRRSNEYWHGADLVMEIVSPDMQSRERDYDKKRQDYAEAGISEYWIVDPQEEKITVLKLSGKSYSVHGEFRPGDAASSALLPGFDVDVTAVFAAARES